MKFGKSYMETIASPNFPAEWRKGAIEYKHLKKLINGVVAELESLGLGTEVLRELLQPESGEAESDVSAEEGDDDAAGRAGSGRKAPSPFGEDDADADAEEEAEPAEPHRASDETVTKAAAARARAEQRRQYPAKLSPTSEDAAAQQQQQHRRKESKAADWLESVPRRHRSASNSSLSGASSSPAAPGMERSESADSIQDFRGHLRAPRRAGSGSGGSSSGAGAGSGSGGAAGLAAARLVDASEESDSNVEVEILEPPPIVGVAIAGAGKHAGGAADRRRSSGLGKKDLRQLRDRLHGGSSADEGASGGGGGGHASESSAGGEPSSLPLPTSRSAPAMSSSFPGRNTTSSASSTGRHDWGAHAWRERAGAHLWKGSDESSADTPLRGTSPAAAQQQRGGAPQRNGSGAPSSGSAAGPSAGAGAGAGAGPRERWVQGKGGRRARAEYELGGTPEHPVPRIRLHIESPETSEDEYDGDQDGEGGDGLPIIQELPPSPEVRANPASRRTSIAASSLPALDASTDAQNAAGSSTASASATRPGAASARSPRRVRPSYHRMRKREILIPLSADTEFLDTLTGALANLQTVQTEQRDHFIADTENLTSAIARASSPYASKNDLYVWREIFALWMEMQIFESYREKDRGELSVDESEARLKRFAEELHKRGWGPGDLGSASASQPAAGAASSGAAGKRLVKRKNGASAASSDGLHPDSVRALEEFMKVNVALLDVKKFQRINVEAARKILKKHDKRTALTASDDLRAFIARQQGVHAALSAAAAASVPLSANGSGSAGDSHALVSTHPSLAALLPSSATGMLSESLPHILLSLLSTTLLPILPSIDDYSCAICTGVAWRPIRLDCTHLFCIRCLVKLQKQGKRDCPLCRAKDVVGTADAKNLDAATTNMLKTWFPKEVGEKEKENETERRKEELKELGLHQEKCTIM